MNTLLAKKLPLWAAVMSISVCIMTIGFALHRYTTYIPNTRLPTVAVILFILLGLVAAVGFGYLSLVAFRRVDTKKTYIDYMTSIIAGGDTVDNPLYAIYDNGIAYSPDGMPLEGGEQLFDERAMSSRLVTRVRAIMEDEPLGYLDPESLEYASDSDKDPHKFAIAASKPGALANDKVAEKIMGKILKSIPEGRVLWKMVEDPVEDRLRFSKKTPFPGLITPPIPSHIVTDLADAKALYNSYRLVVGLPTETSVIEYCDGAKNHTDVLCGKCWFLAPSQYSITLVSVGSPPQGVSHTRRFDSCRCGCYCCGCCCGNATTYVGITEEAAAVTMRIPAYGAGLVFRLFTHPT